MLFLTPIQQRQSTEGNKEVDSAVKNNQPAVSTAAAAAADKPVCLSVGHERVLCKNV